MLVTSIVYGVLIRASDTVKGPPLRPVPPIFVPELPFELDSPLLAFVSCLVSCVTSHRSHCYLYPENHDGTVTLTLAL
jgi:hypothetical protein